MQNEFRGRGGQHAYNTIMLHTQPSIPSSLKFKWAAPEMVEGALLDDDGGETALPSMPFLLPGALHPPKPTPEALLLAESFEQLKQAQSRHCKATRLHYPCSPRYGKVDILVPGSAGFTEGPKLQSVASEASLAKFRAGSEAGIPGRPPRPPDDSASSARPSSMRGRGKANKQRARFSDGELLCLYVTPRSACTGPALAWRGVAGGASVAAERLACSGKSLVHLARRPEACLKHSQPVSRVSCIFLGIASDKVIEELELGV